MQTKPALFRAYLDESEDTAAGIYAVGGFVGRASVWEKLEPKWTECLPSSISFFHTTDCITGNGEFKDLDIPDRVALLDKLTDLLLSHELWLIGYGIDTITYKSLAPKQMQNDFLGNKYAAPFGGVIELACLAMGNGPGPEGVWKVLEEGENWEKCAFFAESNEYSPSASRTISSMRSSRDLWYRDRIGEETYGTKLGATGIPLLQVADLGAFLTAKQLGNSSEGKISWKKYFQKVKNAGHLRGIRWADKRSLNLLFGTVEEIRKEQATGEGARKTPWDAN